VALSVSSDSALVLFSGGQDSTVCLGWALERFARVETVGFDYGQRHAIELDVRPRIRDLIAALKPEWKTRLGDDHVIKLDALAYRRGARHIVAGMCETDYSGYPDCRDETVKAMQVALSLGLDKRIAIHTPLMWVDKAGTFAMAEDLAGQPFLDVVVEDTHSCYLGDRTHWHDWGFGCGSCPACQLRAQGYATFMGRRTKN
jgi:7-cyano-7-deazaguanine synthase